MCVCVCVWKLHRRLCAYAFDLSRGQGPGGLIQRLKFCWEGNEDLKDTPQRRLQITAFSRWATGLQSSLFHWSEQLSVCIKYSKNGPCILARWLLQSSFLTLICTFSSVLLCLLFFFPRFKLSTLSTPTVAPHYFTPRITMTEILKACGKLHRQKKTETLDHVELCLISHCCFSVL